MVTGQLPFKGDYDQAVVYSILNEEPVLPSSIREEMPSHFEQTVVKALEKDPVLRYQSMQDLLEELKKPLPLVTAKEEKQKSIVVLPFDDISPNKDNEYFSDGMTEEIISDLSQINDLLVISRSSAMTYKGTKKKIREIGKELKVQFVLEGSVRKAGNSLRITAQLIDAISDAHLWAEKYSGKLDDVFEIQEEVSRSIVEALKLKLNPEEEKKLSERPIDNAHANECYLKARSEIMLFTKDGIERALKHLQNGLEIIGKNSVLYAGIGFAYLQYVNIGIEQEEYLEKAEEYANKAFELDPESGQAHFTLGVLYMLRGNLQKAINHLKKAHSIDPNHTDVTAWLGFYYILSGKTVAATPLIEKALKIDPINPNHYLLYGGLGLFEGRFGLAVDRLAKSYKMAAEVTMIQFWYALCLAYNQCFEDAISIVDQGIKSSVPDIWTQLSLFLKFALKEKKDQISKLLTKDFLKTIKRDMQYSYHIATFYSYLNQTELAIDWLENAVDQNFINYPFMNEIDPFLKNIRGEERFKKLIERVKKEWEELEV